VLQHVHAAGGNGQRGARRDMGGGRKHQAGKEKDSAGQGHLSQSTPPPANQYVPLTCKHSNWPFNLTLPRRPSKRRGRRSSNPSAPSRKSSQPSPTATTSSAPSPLREGEGWLRWRDVDLSLCPRSDLAALWRVGRARLCWTSGLTRGGADLRRFKSFGSFASASMAKLPVVKER
jgi:hypothetical protein